MEVNALPGPYNLYVDPIQATGQYSDPVFQPFFQGSNQSKEWKDGVIANLLGVKIVKTNMALSAGNVRKARPTSSSPAKP